MAGDKISNLERRMGEDEYKRVGQDGLQGGITTPGMGGSGQKRYSAAEVKSEFRNNGRTVDEGSDSNVNYFQGLVNSGSKFNGKATSFLQSQGIDFSTAPGKVKPVEETTPTKEGGNESVPSSPTASTTGNRSPIYQMNTAGGPAAAITGNNNTIDQSVDNSRTYEGSDRTFNYNPSEKSLYDSPVSMATMAGYYDVDDSPAATQKFLDQYIDSNSLAQKGLQTAFNDRTDFDYKSKAESVNQFNPQAMQERIDKEPLIDRDRAEVGLTNMFGDKNRKRPDWMKFTSPEPIESEVNEISEMYRNELS